MPEASSQPSSSATLPATPLVARRARYDEVPTIVMVTDDGCAVEVALQPLRRTLTLKREGLSTDLESELNGLSGLGFGSRRHEGRRRREGLSTDFESGLNGLSG